MPPKISQNIPKDEQLLQQKNTFYTTLQKKLSLQNYHRMLIPNEKHKAKISKKVTKKLQQSTVFIIAKRVKIKMITSNERILTNIGSTVCISNQQSQIIQK